MYRVTRSHGTNTVNEINRSDHGGREAIGKLASFAEALYDFARHSLASAVHVFSRVHGRTVERQIARLGVEGRRRERIEPRAVRIRGEDTMAAIYW
ncbi:hypothetical protein KM043_006976 [Ampulex compressa]|nr:hypothetical protein KM043_006976 [Ampulex compressa]